MLWVDHGGHWAPALPLAPALVPGGVAADGPAMVARIVFTASGPVPTCVLALPAGPQHVERRLVLEYQRLRRHDRRLTWEDLLRDRGEVVYRTACEWCWWHRGGEWSPLS
jgi:hypothetical protein